jgi:hypothetical protein
MKISIDVALCIENTLDAHAELLLTDLGQAVKWMPMTLIHHQGIICGVAFSPEAGGRSLLPRLPPGQACGVLLHTPHSSLLGA